MMFKQGYKEGEFQYDNDNTYEEDEDYENYEDENEEQS